MTLARLTDLTNGWCFGGFSPTLWNTSAVEVAVKNYPAGFRAAWHFHKVATEYTVIVAGEVEMNGRRFSQGDIIVIPPGEGTDFLAITDTVTTVVKLPGAPDDKYFTADSPC